MAENRITDVPAVVAIEGLVGVVVVGLALL
jgi:hypothetical protein